MELTDTNAIIWFLTGDAQLGGQSTLLISDALNRGEAAFSTISIWEIGMLLQKGRITMSGTADEYRRRLLALRFKEIRVSGTIAARAGCLLDMHGDPADRIIVATAIGRRRHRLITSDRKILNWPHQLDRFPATR